MAINSIINAEKYSEELDKVFAQKSVTGFFADNALAAKFVGAKTVIIPDIDFEGLVNYDRSKGYDTGKISVSNVSHTMTMDRARSLQIDREDLDETGIANLAGKVLGEYVRTKVVPECDAYVLSKLANTAIETGNVIEGYNEKPIATMIQMISEIQGKVGFDTELVAFVSAALYGRIQASDEFAKLITTTDFKQGEINFQVKSFNGVPILPVVNERMKSDFNFKTNNGGFADTEDSRDVYMIICPKNAVHLVKKTESMRIFTPEQNLDADAYKFDYRIYYDAFIGKHDKSKIYAWLSKKMRIAFHPIDNSMGSSGSCSLEVHADISEDVVYKWYKCDDIQGNNPQLLAETEEYSYDLYGYNYALGTHYFFVRVYSDELSYKQSRVVTITVV